MTSYTLLNGHQKCHPTFELILPRRKVHMIKLLIAIPIITLILTTIYYQFYYDSGKDRFVSMGTRPLSIDQYKYINPYLGRNRLSNLSKLNPNKVMPEMPEFYDASNSQDINQQLELRRVTNSDEDANLLHAINGEEQVLPSVVRRNKINSYDQNSDKIKQKSSLNNVYNNGIYKNQEKDTKNSDSPVFVDVASVEDLNQNSDSFVQESDKNTFRRIQAKKNGRGVISDQADSTIERIMQDEQKEAQSVAVIPPPNEQTSYGELGRPVILKNLTIAQQNLVKVGWENNAFNQYISDLISLNRSLPEVRDPSCKRVKYPDPSELPATSIIICFHNEAWSVLLRTIHSAINRSPDGLIKEIILVDDFSTKKYLGKQLEEYIKPFKIVKVVRATKREGLIRARLLGAEHATAPVLTFLDSHCECAEGWLEPLLARIKEDSTAVVCPVIDVISDKTFEYHYRNDANAVSVGGFDWNLQFNWHTVPEREKKRRKHNYDPIRSPTMAGGLFSIDKAFFERLGTYDSGFDIWGGENLELSFKTWMCGGTLEIVPCSHVGHVFRSRSPYKWRTGVNVLRKNSVRLAEVWMDDYKKYYYDRIGHDLGDYGDISDRIELRKRLECKPFSYFVKEIYPELFIPGEAVAYGEIRNQAGGKIKMCLDSPAQKSDLHKPVGVYPCHGSGGNQYWLLSRDGEIRRDEACIDYSGRDVILYPCHGLGGNQLWYYDKDTMQIKHSTSDRCLELSDRTKLQMKECDAFLEIQKWKFQHFNSTLADQSGL